MKTYVIIIFFILVKTAQSQNTYTPLMLEKCRITSSIDQKINCLKKHISENLQENLNLNIGQLPMIAIKEEFIKISYFIETNGKITLLSTGKHPLSKLKILIDDILKKNIKHFQILKTEEGNYLEIEVDQEILIRKENDLLVVEEFLKDQKKPKVDYVTAKYSSCKRKSGKKAFDCTASKIRKEILYEFNKDLGRRYGLTGINRVFVNFTVTADGKIKDIKTRAPHPKLEEEAERIIKLLPDFIPAYYNGHPISTMFSLPITFTMSN